MLLFICFKFSFCFLAFYLMLKKIFEIHHHAMPLPSRNPKTHSSPTFYIYAKHTYIQINTQTHTYKNNRQHCRSIADGQSQHSFSNNSHRGYLGTAFPSNLVNSRPELRQSRQSLAAASERMSRASYAGSIHGGGPQSVASSTRRSRPRSRSRDQLNTTHIHNHRPGSR